MPKNASDLLKYARFRQYRRSPHAEKRMRYRCTECGGQFWDTRDDAKMWRHGERSAPGGHIGYQAVPRRHRP